ncbi:MAG: hypothetical protein AAFU54_30940 [Chloroflexota bacterium]
MKNALAGVVLQKYFNLSHGIATSVFNSASPMKTHLNGATLSMLFKPTEYHEI